MQRDIRKWLMKPHDSGNGSTAKPATTNTENKPKPPPPLEPEPEPPVQESVGRRKTSKYFATDKQKPEDEKEVVKTPAKRKSQSESNPPVKATPPRKVRKVEDDEDDDEFVMQAKKKISVDATPSKKLKSGSGRGISQKAVVKDESEEDEAEETEKPPKAAGRGRGGRGAAGAPAGGRGRGGGRGGFMNFGERKDPPHKGEKEVPEGAPDCLAGLTFVISGTLDSLEREEAEDLIKRHGGRITGSVSRKTSYLLCDEDIEGRKSAKAKELGTAFLTEDGLFDKIRKSKPAKVSPKEVPKASTEKVSLVPKKSPQKAEVKGNSSTQGATNKGPAKAVTPLKRKQSVEHSSLPWTEKYRPKVPNDLVGNQSLVNQLHNWLKSWNDQFLGGGKKGKGKQNDSAAKKAVLLSGTPGIGKTTSAKLACQMLGFQAVEVNASDTRGKADSKIFKGIGGSNANSIKELVNNESLSSKMDRPKHPKTVLIMDEVDGMSAGDRGGVADLIASIKISKMPIVCICNDRYSQKLKSLLNYCLVLTFRKPTKQQMAKRLMQIACAEGLKVNEIALEELAERVNGDMRMAVNQLQYMSLSMSTIQYDDVRQRLQSSAKDEDISPFTAVDKLFNFNSSKLRMDQRVDLSMSDPDLVPLIIQENYINYRPSLAAKDENGIKRMNLLSRAADSIADGDLVNVQIRRHRQWQLFQAGSLASCIIPAALVHGQRETMEPGERNFNRFGGWLGKNSTTGKNMRLLEDLHVHLLASRESNMGRGTLRLDYLTLLLKKLTDPLRELPKDEAVEKVVEFMDVYSISQEDMETIVELAKFKGHPNPLEGIHSTVKSALTRAYKDVNKSRLARAADLVPISGMKKAPKKRIAAMLEPPVESLGEENVDPVEESEDENSSDTEDPESTLDGEKLQSSLQSLNSKGIKVEMELKSSQNSKGKKAAGGRGRGAASSSAEKKPAGRGRGGSSSAGTKRKR
ncbi:Replication factor C subunit 1 [Linum grandiflorum]